MNDIKEILKIIEEKMKNIVFIYKEKLTTLRTTIANPMEMAKIMVIYYGNSVSLNTIANVTIPEPNQFLIKPYDPEIKNHILQSLSNEKKYNPIDEGKNIRIILPPLSEEARLVTIKELHEISENFRIEIRHERKIAMDSVKSMEHLQEDIIHIYKEKIQTLTNKYIDEINKIMEKKEMSIKKL